MPAPGAGDAQPNPAQTQPQAPQQEPAAENADTHQEEQGPVEDEVHSQDTKSESEASSRRKDPQNANCSASEGRSLEGSLCNESDLECEQRTNQPRDANPSMEADREP